MTRPILLLLFICVTAAQAESPAPEVGSLENPAPQRILFIGNSYLYYNDSLHNHVRRIAEEIGPYEEDGYQYKSATIGGARLAHHPVDTLLQPGRLGIDEPFELVIFQGGSDETFSEEGREQFRKSVHELSGKARATGAEVALYMTHAYVAPHRRAAPALGHHQLLGDVLARDHGELADVEPRWNCDCDLTGLHDPNQLGYGVPGLPFGREVVLGGGYDPTTMAVMFIGFATATVLVFGAYRRGRPGSGLALLGLLPLPLSGPWWWPYYDYIVFAGFGHLVLMMLESAGFEVINLGVDVAPEKFVEDVKEHDATIVGISALLTTTMGAMKDTIDALTEAGYRDKVKVIIGGAPVTQKYADEIGADGYAADAGSASKLAKSLAG